VTETRIRAKSSLTPDFYVRRYRDIRPSDISKEDDVRVQAPGTLLQGSGGITPGKMRLYMQLQLVRFRQKVVRNAVHNAFLNTLTMGTVFPRVPPRNDPPGGANVLRLHARNSFQAPNVTATKSWCCCACSRTIIV